MLAKICFGFNTYTFNTYCQTHIYSYFTHWGSFRENGLQHSTPAKCLTCTNFHAKHQILKYFLLRKDAICNRRASLMKPRTSPTQRLAYISSLRLNMSLCSVWAQMETWNVIGCCKWPFCLQQTNCQALHMKEGLKMQLADVRVMQAMWVSGE